MTRDFLKCLEPVLLPALPKALCAYLAMVSVFQQEVDNSALAFISCLCKSPIPDRGEKLGPSHTFSRYAHSSAYVLDF